MLIDQKNSAGKPAEYIFLKSCIFLPISLLTLAYLEKPENKGFLTSFVAYVFYTVNYSGHPTTSLYLQSAYSVNRKELLMTKIIFSMYNPETDCVEVSLNDEIHVSFNCQKCNASVLLNEPSDIAYLTRLAREEPGLYAKLASRDGGLQGYVEAMGELN